MSLWWLLVVLLAVLVVLEEVEEGRDGWGRLWVQLLLPEGGLSALVLLLLRAPASCARLAAQAQATGNCKIRLGWRWTTRATLS